MVSPPSRAPFHTHIYNRVFASGISYATLRRPRHSPCMCTSAALAGQLRLPRLCMSHVRCTTAQYACARRESERGCGPGWRRQTDEGRSTPTGDGATDSYASGTEDDTAPFGAYELIALPHGSSLSRAFLARRPAVTCMARVLKSKTRY